MEHLHHFGLDDDPFRNRLRLRDYVETPASNDALLRLERGVRQQRGLVLFTGDVGAGKSFVVRQFLEVLEDEVFEASLLVLLKPVVDAHWLLIRFAKLLGVEEPQSSPDALLAEVYEQLAIVRGEGRHAVLIVDDADALAAGGALAEVCGWLKLEYEEQRLFTLILAGGSGLAEAIAADPSLQQHTEVHVHMQPLDASAGSRYLEQRLEGSGGNASLFEPAAASALHEIAGGRPGLMNVLADNALYEAFLAGGRSVGVSDMERAHAALGWSAIGAPPASPDSALLLASTASAADELPREPSTAESTVLMESALGDSEPLDLFDPLESTDGALDSDLDAVFADSGPLARQASMPDEGPPKADAEEDLVVELLDE